MEGARELERLLAESEEAGEVKILQDWDKRYAILGKWAAEAARALLEQLVHTDPEASLFAANR